jgi:hypothetical protein
VNTKQGLPAKKIASRSLNYIAALSAHSADNEKIINGNRFKSAIKPSQWCN